MRHSIPTASRALALSTGLGVLAAAGVAHPVSADLADPPCVIRFAEAKVCPSVHLFDPDYASVLAASGDGSTLVGCITDPTTIVFGAPRQIPVRWVHGKLEELDVGLAQDVTGCASAVSRDGSVIGGGLTSQSESTIFLWQDGVVEIRAAWWWERPTDMSGDGQILSGQEDAQGWRWAEGHDKEYWTTPQGGWIYTTGISEAGDIIVGLDVSDVIYPRVWIGDTSTVLPTPPSGLGRSGALGISPDGSVIVGISRPNGALWRDGVFEPLPFRASDASFDGLFLVGPTHFWNASGAAIEISTLLAGLGLEQSLDVYADPKMSNDGHVLVGDARVAGQPLHTWTATVSPKLGIDVVPGFPLHLNRINLSSRQPVVVRVFGSAQADVAAIEPEDLFFGPARAHPIDARPPQDHNHDGHPDRDFLFDVTASGLAVNDREVCLAGVASELPFRLCAPAHAFVPGCGRGAELALVVPLAIVVRRGSRRLRARLASAAGGQRSEICFLRSSQPRIAVWKWAGL